jgi:hypothetical protein
MREICYSAKCSAKHIIIIDDIDWVLYRNERQYKALAALIQAAYEMNRTLRDNEVNAKIVVLCRTDLFEKLEGPNLNKAKQFGGLIIDWYQKTTDIYSTNLVHLLNKRAEATLGQKVDVYKLMPRTLHHPTPMLKTLIEYTRHTPRDLIHVMKYIQAYTTDGNPDILEIKDGIKKYSEVYLIQEIHDEISSYLTNEEIDNIFSVFATMKKSRFSINELTQFTCKYPDDSVQSMDIMRVLKALFDSGAIGNISRVKGYGDFVTFKHRNRNALFNPTEDIMIHRGLEKGLRLLPNHEK